MPKVARKSKVKPVLAARPPIAKKRPSAPTSKPSSRHKKPNTQPSGSRWQKTGGPPPAGQHWKCASVIDQQSSEAIERLLAAAETRTAGATIKSLTLAPHVVHKKPTFAVTCETLKHLPLLKQLTSAVGLLEQPNHKLSAAAAYVLTYELLFGQGFRRKGPAEAAVMKQKDELHSGLQKLLQDAGVQDAAAWLQMEQQQQQQQQQHNQPAYQQPVVPHPRYARVNTLAADVDTVLQQLQSEADSSKGAGRNISSSRGGGVRVDDLLPDVLVFPPGTDLHDHPLVKQGVLILQGKASCMPAHALQPRPGWHVVDCCAAPGNKTTHVAALLQAASTAAPASAAGTESGAGRGSQHSKKKRKRQQAAEQGSADAGTGSSSGSLAPRVFAFDKDPKRARRLAENVQRVGAQHIVSVQRADFLSIDPLAPEFAQVAGVILDPSCSGSGTAVSRMDHLLPVSSSEPASSSNSDQQHEQQRLEQLAKFQEAALLHALKFPALQRLVYSTCSIHQRENEDVVAAVLPTATAAGFQLVDPFPSWHRRGLEVVQGSELLVRTDPLEDGTDGFFVAVFERQPEAPGTAAGAHERESKRMQKEEAMQQQQEEEEEEEEGKGQLVVQDWQQNHHDAAHEHSAMQHHKAQQHVSSVASSRHKPKKAKKKGSDSVTGQ